MEHEWPGFPPACRKSLAEVFALAVGKTVRLDTSSGGVDFTIADIADFDFVLGNYSVEADRRAGRFLTREESIMGAAQILRERLGL